MDNEHNNLERFAAESGFKILAVSKFSAVEYRILLYLINCAASGLDEIIITLSEFSYMLDVDKAQVSDAIRILGERNVVKFGVAKSRTEAFRLSMQFKTSSWNISDLAPNRPFKDAVIFPFRSKGRMTLKVFEGGEAHKPNGNDSGQGSVSDETSERVFNAFISGRSLDDSELNAARISARTLVDTHPVDQILLLLRHFVRRIPTLSLLASSWQHFQELFIEETQKIDLSDARQKHHESDEILRTGALHFLEKSKDLKLTDEETQVLEILSEHPHPRRQLFWAYQAQSRYPGLKDFFSEYATLMLSPTLKPL